MDRALLTPRWIISHVLMGIGVVVMVFLGFWQLDRLDERRSRNDEIEQRTALPVDAIGELVAVTDPFSIGEDVQFRIARASGTYAADDEILVRNRSLNGAPGFWVLTPLVFDDGSAVVVNRGWVPFSMGPGRDRTDAMPIAGRVTVTGMVRETVVAEGLAQADAAGTLDSLGRVDLARYQEELDYPILPVFIQLEAQEPEAQGQAPFVLDRPDLDDGPHLSYAVQWFIFATIAGVGYPLVLWRLAQRRAGGERLSDIPAVYLD